jgi:hypothetical protein
MFRTLMIGVAAAIAATGTASASTPDDAGAIVVVPLTADSLSRTRLFVQNHQPWSVPTDVVFVPARSAGASALPHLACKGASGSGITLAANSVTEIDLVAECPPLPTPMVGMVVVRTRDSIGLGTVSARGVVDTSFFSGVARQTLQVDGIPVAYLDTTDNIHVAGGLRWDVPFAGSGTGVTSDCFLGTFFGTGSGVLGRITLRDEKGIELGKTPLFQIANSFELVRVSDVFTAASVSPGAYKGVRAEFGLAGGGEAVIGYCSTKRTSFGASTFALSLAQVVEPQDETRRRQMTAYSTPGGLINGQRTTLDFVLDPSVDKAQHGLYVRHPDILSCRVNALQEELILTAIAPDRSVMAGGNGSATSRFATITESHAAQNDLWGLEVSWHPSSARNVPVGYSLSCFSGNGTSLADLLP